MTRTETTARSMTKAERVAYLKARGWRRISSSGSQSWLHPNPRDRAVWSLAAAIRHALRTAAPTCAAEEHVWGRERRVFASRGPMDGEWITADCRECNTFSLKPVSGGSGLELIIAALAAASCDPRPLGVAS